ncbi:MAG: hypothetical protein JWO81_1566 [Alphaproteobacteria bacterium]|nr:hypothetical protein [Alphaproteobacteria bacterium]
MMHDGAALSTYEREPAAMCQEPPVQLSDAPFKRGSIDFPATKLPAIMKVNLASPISSATGWRPSRSPR